MMMNIGMAITLSFGSLLSKTALSLCAKHAANPVPLCRSPR